MTSPRRGWLTIPLAFALLVGCGVTGQADPVPVKVEPQPQATTPSPGGGGYSATVYFSRDGRLTPVTRAAPDTSSATVLALLVAGPTGAEAATGLQTALVPQQMTARTTGARAITVAATRDFSSISGDQQLLGTAQVVWTLTDNAPDGRVRIIVDGQAIQLPTDNGLVWRPVERGDYMSVAPREPSPAPPVPTPS